MDHPLTPARHKRLSLQSDSGASGAGTTVSLSTSSVYDVYNHQNHNMSASGFRSDINIVEERTPLHPMPSQMLSQLPKTLMDADEVDIEELRQGLNFALGTSATEANWFPTAKHSPEKKTVPIADRARAHSAVSYITGESGSGALIHADLAGDDSGYAENIPMVSVIPPPLPNVSAMRGDITSSHSPFANTQRSSIRRPSLMVNTDIEDNGLKEPSAITPLQQSATQRFADAFSRLTDRIAANTIMESTPIMEDSEEAGLEDMHSSNSKRSLYILASNLVDNQSTPSFFLDPARGGLGTSASAGLGISLDDSDEQRHQHNKNSIIESEYAVLREIEEPILHQINPLSHNRDSYQHYPPQQNLDVPSARASISSSRKTQERREISNDSSMYLFGKSLGLFGPSSPIRQSCFNILCKQYVNSGFLCLLFLQVALLSYRQWNPYVLGGYYYSGYDWADWVLVGINVAYTVEVFMKIITYGLFDDRIMYEECGLQYPSGSILHFNLDVARRILERWNLVKSHSINDTAGKKFRYQHPNSNSELDIKEISLDDNVNKDMDDLRRKYQLSLHHNEDATTNQNTQENQHTHEQTKNTKFPKKANTFLIGESRRRVRLDTLHLKRAFLRSSWHRIDFISMCMFWISFILSYNRYDTEHSIYIFRALSCLRILRLTNLTTGTSTILAAVKLALPQLFDVSLFIVCFWFFFGIIGVQSFKSSLTRQCVWTNPEDPTDQYNNTAQYCGSYLDATTGKSMPYIQRDGTPSTVIKGFTCPVNSQCVSMENPYGGTLSFDNIFQSMEIVFVIMTANTFTDILYDTTDTDSLASSLFFVATIFVMTVWLLNIFIAVIFNSFNIARMEQEQEKLSRGKTGFRIFGSGNEKILMNTDRIKFLKNENMLLRIFYRFDFVWVLLINADLFVQCFRLFDMSESTHSTLYRLEAVFTIIFAIEIVLRLIFHFPHWRLFFVLKRNCFDLFLAVITGIIIIGPIKDALGQAYYWLTVFQIARFYRVILSTRFTRDLWLLIMKNFKTLLDLAIFFFILLFLVSIILARFFEGTIPHSQFTSVEFPMHTLPNVFVGLYIITSTENWTAIMYPLQENALNVSSRCFGAMMLCLWFIVSNFVVLNLFIAIIANSLEVGEFGKRKQQLLQFIDNMTDKLHNLDTGTGVLTKVKNKIFRKLASKEELEKTVVNLLLSGAAVKDFLEEQEDDEAEAANNVDDNGSIKTLPASRWRRWIKVNFFRSFNIFRNPFYSKPKFNFEVDNFEPSTFAKQFLHDRNALIKQQNKFLEEHPNFNKVFYVMAPNHRVRKFCQRIVKSSYGERIDGVEPHKTVLEVFIVIMFFASVGLVVTACYLTPLLLDNLQKNHGTWNWSAYLESAFTVFFSIEFLLKILADGLIFTPNAYARSVWNNIDFIVLVALWIEFIAFLKDDGKLSRIVRGLKALRALRLLTISETAKSNFYNTMIAGFGKIINAGIISIGLLFPFSIWGLNIFNGRLGYCVDGLSGIDSCINEYQNGVYEWNIVLPNVWTEPYLEFNRWVSSFSTLFQIVSFEGWVDLLDNVTKLTGIGTPQEDFAQPFNGFFVILFNFISTIFILTLFVSVIIVNYSKTTGRAYLTDDQMTWYQVKNILLQVKASKRKTKEDLQNNLIKRISYNLTVGKNVYWQMYLNIVLLFHILSLLLETFPVIEQIDILRSVIFFITAISFSVNITMLIIAQGYKTFFNYKWNVFFLIVSWGSFVCTIIGLFLSSQNGFVKINKLFLVGILFNIIPRSNRLSQLLRFASVSGPTLAALSFTWGIVFLMFAIALNQIFGVTKVGPNGTDNLNLRSVPKALILLFRCSFGEGWNYIMIDYTLEEPFCSVTSDGTTDCGNKQYAYILFIAWNLTSMYIFLNMFVSLILDSFSYINNTSPYIKFIQRDELRKFKQTWHKFDPEGTGYIKPVDLPKLLHSLDGALSFHLYTGSLEIKELCQKWFIRNNPFDPYDITVKHDVIEETLAALNIPKIRARRLVYERFVQEALLTMELKNNPGISFTLLLLQLPLYIAFDACTCLNLIDFLERRLLLQKVEKRLKIQRVHDIMTTYAVRWKYKKDHILGIRDSNIEYGERFRRQSYLENPELMHEQREQRQYLTAPAVFVTDENSQVAAQLYRPNLVSPGLNNPFKDDMDPIPDMVIQSEPYDSHVYVPTSPIRVVRSKDMRNRMSPSSRNVDSHLDAAPQLFVRVPQSGMESITSDNDIDLTEGEHHSDQSSSLLDISQLSEQLEHGGWGDALREVQSEHGLDTKHKNK